MILTKAMALLTLMTVFWLSAARAHTVEGSAALPKGFFGKQRQCVEASRKAHVKAEKLCQTRGLRGVDKRSVREGGCWYGQGGAVRTIKLRFECE